MLFISLVVYNKKIENIRSKESIIKLCEEYGAQNIRVIVVDNSDKTFDSGDIFLSGNEVTYIKNGKNLGLSKAYNRAVKCAKKISNAPENDFMLFLDDDTYIPYEYLNKVYKNFEALSHSDEGVNVITGLVKSGERPLSPMKGYRFRYKSNDYIVKPGIYDDITFINSGTAIRLGSIIEVNGFNEDLFLDMIDYTIAYELSRHRLCRVKVLNSILEQKFSGRTRVSKKRLLKRFNIYKKDFKKYCEITGRSKIFCRLALLKRRLMIELKSD